MNHLKDKFISNIKKILPGDKGSRFLLTVSGGLDSVVMAHLFHANKFDFGIAHCNFQLRDNDADKDEAFVSALAGKLKVPFYSKKFNTAAYAQSEVLSIQVAARELRYEWFGELCSQHHFDYIATAHHADDNMETMLLNFTRGKGLVALAGIPGINQNIIRPLLFAGKKEIQAYATENHVEWREDLSNQSTDYDRNYLRLKVLPLLQELNPSLEKTLSNSSEFLLEAALFIGHEIEKWKTINVIATENKTVLMNISQLQLHPLKSNILYDLLSAFDFPPAVIRQVNENLKAQPGTTYLSQYHTLVFDRDNFSINRNHEYSLQEQIWVKRNDEKIKTGSAEFHFEVIPPAIEIFKNNNPDIAFVDATDLEYPLLLRHWQEGDAFCPLGMQQFKKLSDFFIDEKVPLTEKESIWLLTNNGEIVWVAGYRMDDRFKVTANTKTVLKITFAPS